MLQSNVIGKGAHRAAHEPVLLEGEMELVSKISVSFLSHHCPSSDAKQLKKGHDNRLGAWTLRSSGC